MKGAERAVLLLAELLVEDLEGELLVEALGVVLVVEAEGGVPLVEVEVRVEVAASAAEMREIEE